MTVIFFCPLILRDYFKELFDIEGLMKQGYNPIFLDATKYYNSVATATDELILSRSISCGSEEDFRGFKKMLPKEPVLYLIYDLQLNMASKPLDLIFRKHDKILSYHSKRFAPLEYKKSKIKKIADYIVKYLGEVLPIHFLSFYYKTKSKYKPDYYLCSTKHLIPPKIYLTIPKRKRYVVHADDINKLIYLKSNKLRKEKKFGVFLDQGIPFLRRTHPKLYTKGYPPGYLEEYYKKVRTTLSLLKDHYELDEIVIALHPDAVKFQKELSGKFDGFPTILGETPKLIRDAEVVFGHNSTSLSYAVYFNKPAIVFTDHFLRNYHQRIWEYIKFFIDQVGMVQIDMDANQIDQIKNLKKGKIIDFKKYNKYLRKFVKDNNIQENSYHYAIRKIEYDMKKNNEYS